jgi:hypothetical protein
MSQESHPQGEYGLRAKNLQSFDSVLGADSQAEGHGEGTATGAGEDKTSAAPADRERKELRGGTYAEAQALTLINGQHFIGLTDSEVGIYRVNDDGSATFIPEKDFKLLLANVRVQRKGGALIPAEKFWREHPQRLELNIIFDPRETKPGEYNLWRGFAVQPKPAKGWGKLKRLLKHIYKVICRRDRRKFWYLMRWLGWAVQNPDKAPGTIIVLKSTAQGTGKSTLGVVMCDLFGRHGRRIDDKEQLLGRFNAELETACFILAEEILWAGDSRTADKLKSRITSDIIPIEAKYRGCREVPNRMHMIMTTNHDHAVPAGVKDRRFVVFDVSEEHVQDAAWFEPLYEDLRNGGREEFLWLLLNLKLDSFHPRRLVKTEEAVEQQRMSSDSVSQWCQACIDADAIIGLGAYRLGQDISSEQLRQSYASYCQQHGLRPATKDTLSKALKGMFGPRIRLPASMGGTHRPWGYPVPDGDTWQGLLDERLGLKGH